MRIEDETYVPQEADEHQQKKPQIDAREILYPYIWKGWIIPLGDLSLYQTMALKLTEAGIGTYTIERADGEHQWRHSGGYKSNLSPKEVRVYPEFTDQTHFFRTMDAVNIFRFGLLEQDLVLPSPEQHSLIVGIIDGTIEEIKASQAPKNPSHK